jgi:hypothetical protein
MKIPTAKYADWRQNIQTGDILACMGKSKMSKGIQWTEHKQDKEPLMFKTEKKSIKGFFSHVGVFVRVLDQIFIVEANGKTVDFTRFSRTYKGYDGHLFVIRSRDELCRKILAARCLEVEGAKYDWKSIWQQLIRVFNKEIKHKEDGRLFCSELLNMASGYYWESKDEWCTPHDIALKERNNFLVLLEDVE